MRGWPNHPPVDLTRTHTCGALRPLDEQGFWEIETPIPAKSTPDGLRELRLRIQN
jgi:aspartyl-tRNA synthetase